MFSHLRSCFSAFLVATAKILRLILEYSIQLYIWEFKYTVQLLATEISVSNLLYIFIYLLVIWRIIAVFEMFILLARTVVFYFKNRPIRSTINALDMIVLTWT